jgi:hypothetical protein
MTSRTTLLVTSYAPRAAGLSCHQPVAPTVMTTATGAGRSARSGAHATAGTCSGAAGAASRPPSHVLNRDGGQGKERPTIPGMEAPCPSRAARGSALRLASKFVGPGANLRGKHPAHRVTHPTKPGRASRFLGMFSGLVVFRFNRANSPQRCLRCSHEIDIAGGRDTGPDQLHGRRGRSPG